MSSDSYTTITYTLMSSYEVIVNEYFGMPMDPLDPYVQLVMEAPPSPDYIPEPEAPPSPDYIPEPEAPPSPDYIPRPEYLEYLSPGDDVFPTEEQPLPAAVSPTAELPRYITDSEPKMEPEEDDGDDEKSKGDSIEFPKESDEIERYVGRLPEMIRGNVMSCEPKSMQKAIEFANDQMDQKLLGIADRQANNKRKFNNTSRNQQNQQPFKRNNNGNQNQAGNGNDVARAYRVGTAGGNPDANVVTGTFLLNNHCATILFDTGADKSFVSTAFSSLININPSTLDYSYDVELADGQIIRVNTVIRGCTLNFLNHPFNIDLMPVELGSFNVIIGMDWLKTYHAVIVCDEKIIRVPFRNETLIIRCNKSSNGTQLNIISCTKTRKYLIKGYPVFLANITTKTIKDKSEEKRLENVPIVRYFSEVFPKDLPGLPPTQQVEFQINLIPGAAPVARAPYRLAPS
nr:putative reverse transcriptase domain-containing protein [Tanacetum cinerariifolium]